MSSLPSLVHDLYYKHMINSLGHVIMNVSKKNPHKGRLLLTAVDNLPDESFLRLITAPETFRRLKYKGFFQSDVLAFLTDSVEAEYFRTGLKFEVLKDIWSALGDCYFPKGKPAHNIGIKRILQYDPDKTYFAPILKNGIPVDYCSPSTKGKLPGNVLPPEEYGIGEVMMIIGNLNESIEKITFINKNLSYILSYFTKIISIRKHETLSPYFNSGSSSAYLGRIVLENPQLTNVTVVDLTEALIHETIHSLLYSIELEEPFILDTSIEPKFRVCSPWTGNELPLHSYLHACLIWFGLAHFWKLALKTNAFPKKMLYVKISKSILGFKKSSLLDPLSSVLSYISKDLQDIISISQESIKDTFNSIEFGCARE